MRFQVPQFIEVENKIFGPLTFKQFLYLAGGGGISFVLWSVIPRLIGLPIIVAVVGLSLALAFYKFNNKPFIYLLEATLRYGIGAKLYVWHKEPKNPVASSEDVPEAEQLYVPKLSDSKLKELAWSLDVHASEARQ